MRGLLDVSYKTVKSKLTEQISVVYVPSDIKINVASLSSIINCTTGIEFGSI